MRKSLATSNQKQTKHTAVTSESNWIQKSTSAHHMMCQWGSRADLNSTSVPSVGHTVTWATRSDTKIWSGSCCVLTLRPDKKVASYLCTALYTPVRSRLYMQYKWVGNTQVTDTLKNSPLISCVCFIDRATWCLHLWFRIWTDVVSQQGMCIQYEQLVGKLQHCVQHILGRSSDSQLLTNGSQRYE